MSTAVDNTNLVDMCNQCSCEGFVPEVKATLDLANDQITFEDTTTVVAPDAVKAVHVTVYDEYGNCAQASIDIAGSQTTVNVPTTDLNLNGKLIFKAQVVTTGGCEAVGRYEVKCNYSDGDEFQLEDWLHSQSGAEALIPDA